MRFIISLFILFAGFHLRLHSQPDSVFHPDKLKELVSCLAHDSMKGRFTGSPEILKARDFIARQFADAGLKSVAGNDGYFMPFNVTVSKKRVTAFNVMGALPGKGKKRELVIFSAHYDHVGTLNTNPFPQLKSDMAADDSIYNGANDNASGIAALITLAKYYSSLNNNERTVLFVAFSAEELGMQGSKYLARLIDPGTIKAVINIEMIGRSNIGGKRPMVTGHSLSDLRQILNKQLHERDKLRLGKYFFGSDYYVKQNLFMRSDNLPFAQLGVCAHSIMSTTDTDQFYHSRDDEIETFDFKRMYETVYAIAIACEGITKGGITPKRIDQRNIRWSK
ncbi:MAG: M20/M25/M40 family metallo-hydrolase [Chitinophagaceae bacterium]|nr:M20/M25/M40 family metallo-hydrolase [Chitinophagaceae bacterium]